MASIAELTHGEKSHTQSLSHSPSLFDALGTEAFTLEKLCRCQNRNPFEHNYTINTPILFLKFQKISRIKLIATVAVLN